MNKKGRAIWYVIGFIIAALVLVWFLLSIYPTLLKGAKSFRSTTEELLQSLPSGISTVEEAEELDSVIGLTQEGKCDEAKAILKKFEGRGIEKERIANHWERIGDCYSKKEDYDKAISAYDNFKILVKDNTIALERIDKKLIDLHLHRGLASLRSKKVSEAYIAYDTIVYYTHYYGDDEAYVEELKKKLEKFEEVDKCFSSAKSGYELVDRYYENEKKDSTQISGALAAFLNVIDNYPNSLCVDDAKERLYLLCKSPDRKEYGYGENWCKEADINPNKYYPIAIPKT